MVSRIVIWDGMFQSTLPMKGATSNASRVLPPESVSIHAPNEGSDFGFVQQYTLFYCVSIHAPNEGSDTTGLLETFNDNVFQSTLPMKGATMCSSHRLWSR